MPVTIADPRTTLSTPLARERMRRARVVSNGDTPPCYALVCPNPKCGDVDTLIAHLIDVSVSRRKRSRIDVFELTCTECGQRCLPPNATTEVEE